MNLIFNKILRRQPDLKLSNTNKSLSDFFPKGTFYFYGYPTGLESNFLNSVPPHIEELVAARSIVCSGDYVNPVYFYSTSAEKLGKNICDKLRITSVSSKQSLIIPGNISSNVTGRERNESLKKFLTSSFKEKKLVMAQPFLDDDFSKVCLIDPKITNWLNDKSNLNKILPKNFLPQRYLLAKNGNELHEKISELLIPCVIKVTSSSAGDGVYICESKSDLLNAVNKLKSLDETIAVDQYIYAVKNYGLQFGLSYTGQSTIVGVSEQITSDKGEFIGGTTLNEIPIEMSEISQYIMGTLLPYVYSLGWFGIGCIDVLVDEYGKSFAIDPNFRMTGMSTALLTRKKGCTSLSFIMSCDENSENSLNLLSKYIMNGNIKVLALNQFNNKWNMNVVVYFKNESLKNKILKELKIVGFESELINKITPETA